jgi:hypothetical protein
VDAPPEAVGSPDAPEVAGPIDREHVPELIGLALTDADGLARRSGLTLHVDRIPGHPVGRVVSQVPTAGTPRPPGDVVKVTVTAGGDAPGTPPPPAAVEVRDVLVPDVLDRLPAQARRILEDMGLRAVEEAATGGSPGRVADQLPGAGDVVPKGSAVTIRIAPGTATTSAAPRPRSPAPRERPLDPVPVPAGPPGTLAAPIPVSPPEGTELPPEPSFPIGFTWRAVTGASGYVVEVEEEGPEGWIMSSRRPVRTSAVTVEVERLSASTGALRWRVRAVAAGREGPPSAWVTMR